MKLPAETVISEDKLLRYLLVPQLRGDKSSFLRQAGYELGNALHLLRDLRAQILPLDAIPLESNQFGQYYEIRGTLEGAQWDGSVGSNNLDERTLVGNDEVYYTDSR